MSRIAHLVATAFASRPAVVENESNMWTPVDSDTYATLSTGTDSGGSCFITGFDFSVLPSNAIVKSYEIKIKGLSSSVTSSGGILVQFGTSTVGGTTRMSFGGTTPVTVVYNMDGVSWEDVYSNRDKIRVYCIVGQAAKPTNIYGIEIQVEYDLPVNKVVYGTTVLVDLTEDTVTPDDLSEGVTAHDKSGGLITGTNQRGIMVIRDSSDSHGGTVRTITSGEAQVGGMDESTLRSFILRVSSFKDIDWPDGLTTIGDYAFAGCQYFAPSSLPSGITRIGNESFNYCTHLALASLPSGLKQIGSEAFKQCYELALTSLPSGLTYIGSSTFLYCEKLALTELPSGLTTINTATFQYCKSLALTRLPDGITTIGGNAFNGCSNLQTIACDGIITTLSSGAFTGSSSYPMALTSVSFPKMALTSNISYVFGHTTAACACQQLAFCDIGSTVGIAANAFANCYALQTLVLRKTDAVCVLQNVSAFYNTPMRGYNSLTGTVYVPQALIESYKTATNWSTLYNDGTVTFVAIEGSQYERE